MAKRQSTTKAEPELGYIRKPLDKPERVAELTHAQVAELKERRRLLDKFEAEAQDAAKVVALLRSEYQKNAQMLVQQFRLSEGDDYNIDTEGGAIWRTATYVPVEPEDVKEVTADESVVATNGSKKG